MFRKISSWEPLGFTWPPENPFTSEEPSSSSSSVGVVDATSSAG